MREVLTSDIFFFITATAVVVVATLLIIVLIYLIRILRDIRNVSHKVKEGADVVVEDARTLRAFFKKLLTMQVIAAVARTIMGAAAKVRKGRKTKP